MSHATQQTLSRTRTEKLLIVALMVFGLFFIGYFGSGFARSFLLFRSNPLKPGITNVEAIRPWMTIRYIGVAYGVPQEYIFFGLDIPFDPQDSDTPLRRFNDKYEFGPPSPDNGLPVLQQIQTIIQEYQSDPVATGLNEIRGWMTVQYVANATGVPSNYIFEYLDIQSTQNDEYLPLFELSHKYQYGRRDQKGQNGDGGDRSDNDQHDGPREGRPRDLILRAIEDAILQYQATDSSSMEDHHEHG